jgi:uncharacterized membrane protein
VLQGRSEFGTVLAVATVAIGQVSFTILALRFGFLAAMTGGFVTQLVPLVPWTTDLSVWYADRMLIAIAILGVLLMYGFVIALGGKSLFKDPILERGT